MRRSCFMLLCSTCIAFQASAQTITLPNRLADAPTGSVFARQFEPASLPERESAAFQLILNGDAPDFLRTLCPVEVTNVFAGKTNSGRFFVTPDYLALGSNEDYLLMPMTPESAQRIADALDCILPTRTMVNAIYAAADVKLSPMPIAPSPAMTTLSVFAQHNEMVRTQRVAFLKSHPLGALVAGHKKDVVISTKLSATTNKVAIYGWHHTNGAPIQPLYTGHTTDWVDYSHGIRLVHQWMSVNGETQKVAAVLADPQLAGLISDEGVITNSSYPRHPPTSRSNAESSQLWPEDFVPGIYPGELVRELRLPHEVRIVISAPATNRFASDKPVSLVFYALPNGNTIEQTIGKKLEPGDDWHFDIQHIGAQTRFLRQVITDRNIVVAYLENSLKSWPAWRRQHGDEAIPPMIETVKKIFRRTTVDVVLTGHSGGGSLTFGYLNTAPDIPADITRIAFLDSNYAYDTTSHAAKLVRWLQRSNDNHLCVLAYNDAVALLDGKPFVSEKGGTWGRSHTMLADLAQSFTFTNQNHGTLQSRMALNGRIQFLLKENPERKVLHTVQVERNGFIHAMLSGTSNEGKGYEYFGERAYGNWIQSVSSGK